MSDVSGVAPRPAIIAGQDLPIEPASRDQGAAQTSAILDGTVGPRGPLGQPTGLPAPAVPGERDLLTDVLAGLDPSQLVAAEQMRVRGGASALESLLGLDFRPTSIGEFAPPPLFSKAFRNMSPAGRRAAMRSLLTRRRGELLRLITFIQDEIDHQSADPEAGDITSQPGKELISPKAPISSQALAELNSLARMLSTVERLLTMQDHALSRIGSFSKG